MDNLEFYRGDDWKLDVTLKDEDGLAIDLTGATVFFTVKENESDADTSAVITEDVTSHTDPTNGETSIEVSDTETDDVDPGTYYYDIQVKTAAGNIQTVVKGTLTVLTDITRRTS